MAFFSSRHEDGTEVQAQVEPNSRFHARGAVATATVDRVQSVAVIHTFGRRPWAGWEHRAARPYAFVTGLLLHLLIMIVMTIPVFGILMVARTSRGLGSKSSIMLSNGCEGSVGGQRGGQHRPGFLGRELIPFVLRLAGRNPSSWRVISESADTFH